ncbi:hypothetical protein D9M68_250290 [compost metagenome]
MHWKPMAGVLAVALLSSCDGKEATAPQASALQPASPTPAAIAAAVEPPSAPQLPAFPTPDLSIPLDHYDVLDRDPRNNTSLNYLVRSKSSNTLTDEQKLRYFTEGYTNVRDAFKKKDIAETELPKIDAMLEAYRKQDYYKLDISPGSRPVHTVDYLHVGEYDFATKSFPLLSSTGEPHCWSKTFRGSGGSDFKILPSNVPCVLTVPDEATARAIESVRANEGVRLKGTLYLFIPQVEGPTAQGIAIAANFDVVSRRNEDVLAHFEL